MNIDIIVFDGHDDLDVFGPSEVLRMAELMRADLHASRVTRTPQDAVTSQFQTHYSPDGVYQPGRAEMIIVPGGGWGRKAEHGTWGEVQRGDWLPLLRDAAQRGAIMVSVCAGAMLLAHAGVIGARRAGTHHSAWDDLSATGATLVRDRVVDDGDLITCGGVTSGIDLALWLVEKYASAALAEAVAGNLEYRNRARPVPAGAGV